MLLKTEGIYCHSFSSIVVVFVLGRYLAVTPLVIIAKDGNGCTGCTVLDG